MRLLQARPALEPPASPAAWRSPGVDAPDSAPGDLCLIVMETPNAPNFEAPAAVTASPSDLSRRLGGLLARVAEGDQAAFAEFYQLTSRRVFGMARRVLIDPELSEDTTQEVFLQVWQNAGKFNPEAGSPLSWLMTISHRRAVDKVRSSQSATDREAKYGASSQEVDHDSVSAEVDSKLEAEKLNAAVPTIKSRIRDGLIRLKTCLGVS